MQEAGYDLYFEDFTVGRSFRTNAMTLTESQIIDYALQWDPQPFHIDKEHPTTVAQGGLMASGFHTLNVTFRLFLGAGFLARANLASPGMDKLRWLNPVRPGDTLRVESKVVEAKPSRSKPDRGAITMEHVALNQRGEPVFSIECIHILQKRNPPS